MLVETLCRSFDFFAVFIQTRSGEMGGLCLPVQRQSTSLVAVFQALGPRLTSST